MNTIAELGRLPQVPVDMTLEGLAALNRTQRSDQIGLEELARQQQFNRSADPMRLQQMQTSNDISLQDLGAKTRENRIANRLEPERVMAEYSKYLATAKEADVQLATAKWQEMAMSNDPTISNLGKQGLMRTKEFMLAKQEQDAAAQRAAAGHRSAEKIMGMQIDAGRFTKGNQFSIDVLVRKAKTPIEKAEILESAVAEAYAAGDLQTAQMYAARAQEARQRAAEDAANRAAAKPDAIDVPAVAGMPAAPRPAATAPIATAPSNKPSGGTGQHSLSQLKSMYPGKSEAEIKAAYKAKFGVEPK